jgi:hypothetical protein
METIKSFDEWMKKFGENGVNKFDLWREAMAELRQLHGDVWNGVRFFLTVNGIIIAAIFAVFARYWTPQGDEKSHILAGTIVILSGIGLFLTVIAVRILKKHRDYYLNMLLLKTLLEKELGFYEPDFQGIDLSFPWKVEHKSVDKALKEPDKWITSQRWRRGTISRMLWMTYWFFIALYGVAIIAALHWTGCVVLILILRKLRFVLCRFFSVC